VFVADGVGSRVFWCDLTLAPPAAVPVTGEVDQVEKVGIRDAIRRVYNVRRTRNGKSEGQP
jgi:hypothetical protein